MRKFVLPVIAAGGGDVSFFFEEPGVEWYCGSLELRGFARAGTGGNPVATFPESPGAAFTDCTGPFGIVPEYTQTGDWTMHADSYDPVTETVTGTVQNVAFSWEWPSCLGIVDGTETASIQNTSTVVPPQQIVPS